jgi:hypothetical protein
MNVEAPEKTKTNTLSKCPICHSAEIGEKTHKYIWGLLKFKSIVCDHCKAKFSRVDGGIKLSSVSDKEDAIWKDYGDQVLSLREWKTIEAGGMSDAKQGEVDRLDWLEKLSNGGESVKFIQVPPPVILKKDEKAICVIPEVTLKESRAVRMTHGGYAGPSIRIAKGMSFRLGRFGSTSESHQQIRDIDKGILTLTNQRVVFSGGFKTISLSLDKVISIDPFSDGISLHKEGREKTQYFVWKTPLADVAYNIHGRPRTEPFSGIIFQFLVEDLRRKG